MLVYSAMDTCHKGRIFKYVDSTDAKIKLEK